MCFHAVACVTVSRCGGAAGARLLRACWPVSQLSRCCMWLAIMCLLALVETLVPSVAHVTVLHVAGQ
jgi:hypothetical protein